MGTIAEAEEWTQKGGARGQFYCRHQSSLGVHQRPDYKDI